MTDDNGDDWAVKVASILRPLGRDPLRKEQAVVAATLLNVHWTTVYRLRRRFLNDPVTSSLKSRPKGPKIGVPRLDPVVNQIIYDVIREWLPQQSQLAHPSTDVFLEIGRRCALRDVACPSRYTTARRWKKEREDDALQMAALPDAQRAPGNFLVKSALQVVQIDHTQADLLVVDEIERKVLGRPWLSIALDVATRCVLGFYVAMERPSAATVGLLLTRAVLPKGPWLDMLDVDASWPMRGIPQVLHLDNAAEFKSKALRKGCREYGIELMYRPVGRPHFGGHIERLNRTLMERVRELPGATGSSTKGRKSRKSETTAALTLREFERWMVLDIAKRYHWSPHRGLLGATPGDSWRLLEHGGEGRRAPQTPDAALKFLIRFLPFVSRTIQQDGLTLFRIRYWHPIFSAWRETRRTITVRYHPEDLSRIFVNADNSSYLEVGYADMRRPPVTLYEHRRALKAIRQSGQKSLTEGQIFKTIVEQRDLIQNAKRATLKNRRKIRNREVPAMEAIEHLTEPESLAPTRGKDGGVDYDAPVEAYNVEQW